MAKRKMSRGVSAGISKISPSIKIPRVTKRPMEHSNFSIDKAKNGVIATVSGYIPPKMNKKGLQVGDGKSYNDKYICANKSQAKEILKRAIG